MTTNQPGDRFLRRALLVNKWIAGVGGVVVLLAAGPLAIESGLVGRLGHDLGLLVVFAVGILLMLFSGMLAPIARAPRIDRRRALRALATNAGWGGLSLVLLMAPLPMSVVGMILVVLLTIIAATFAGLEAYGIYCAQAKNS